MTIGEFAEAVMTYCLFYRGSITSFGRTSKHNTDVGSKLPLGPHVFWRGADVVYDNPATQQDASRVEAAKRLGLKLVVEGDHDHLQPDSWPAG